MNEALSARTSLDLFRLDGRRALVTGASRGLGRVFSQALAEAGADVVLSSRSESECRAAADAISSATGRLTEVIVADLSKTADIDRLAVKAERSLGGGGIDILINNAGVNIRGPSDELTEEAWDTVIDLNLKAPFLLSRRIGPAMAARGWGRIINLGSILSVIGLPGRAPYAAAKGGVLNLTRVLALEWASQGVTVNAICPGPFATEMNRPLLDDPEKYRQFVSKIPMGRWGELHEIAGAAVFLASDASSFMTGSPLFIDGGWIAQ